MAVPIRLKSMPEHIRAQYGFPYPQVEPLAQRQQCIDGSQQICEDLQMLQFPKTKVILWDHTVTGPPVYLHFAQYRKPRICLTERVLRIAHRQCASCGKPMECVLIGTLSVDNDGEGLVFSIDRLDNRPGSAATLKNLAPGDVMIPVQMNVNDSTGSGSSVEDYTTAVKLLRQRCESKDTVDVCNYLLTKGWCNFYSRGDQAIAHLDFDVVTLSTVIKASPISPVPIVPTALSKNLAGPKSISHIQGAPKSGYLTMDHTRKLLLVLESDPKVLNLPVVGIWVSGVAMVQHPFVWASCIRYIHNKMLQDRVCSPPEGFLVILYSTLHSRPEFYECNTTTGSSKLSFDLFEGYEATNLNTSVVSLQNGLVECELMSVQPGKKRELFDAALAHHSQERVNDVNQPRGPANGSVSEDIVPRCTPAPHQARISAAKPLVPEVSLYFADPPESVPSSGQSQTVMSQGNEHKKSFHHQNLARHMTFNPPVTPRYNEEDTQSTTPWNSSYPEISHKGTSSQKYVAFTGAEDESQPQSLPTKYVTTQGFRSVNRGQSDAAGDPVNPHKGNLNQNSLTVASEKHVPGHCHGVNCPCCNKQGITSVKTVQSVFNGQSSHADNPVQQRQLNINQNCHPYNQTYHRNEVLPNVQNTCFPSIQSNSALPPQTVQQLHPNFQQTVQQSTNVLIGSCVSQLPHSKRSPVGPQEYAPHLQQVPRPSHTAPTSSSLTTQHVQQLNSAFTPNPHYLQGKITTPHQGQPQHPPQQVTGYLQENLPGFVPQLQTSYSSSQIHTESTCSGKSSDDSGLSVTPDRLNPSPKTGSPNTPDKTSSSLPASSALDTINWEQVPPEIYQLIMAQNAQLQQLQAQMHQLLLQQVSNQPTPTPQPNRTAESGIGVSPSTRETCDTAVNTTLIYPSPEQATPRPCDVHTVSLQTSPVKTLLSSNLSTKQPFQPETDSVPSSSTQTPVEIRHKGVLPLNSTQRDEHDQHDITQGDLTAVADNIALHNQTVDSVQSELILDMPSYQSSPTSHSQKESLDGSYQTSPISASMYADSKESSSQGDREEGESGPVDEAYYEHLLGNIRHLLNSHNTMQESRDEGETVLEDLQMKLPDSTQEDSSLPGNTTSSSSPARTTSIQQTPLSHVHLRNGADTTFIPRINYLSMMLDSDSDTSMEINAMALKYLTDDQLTQLGKLRKNSLNLPKQVSKTALLRKVLMNDTTLSSDVSQYGMSANNITMGTQKYLEKYGLLNSSSGSAPTDETVTEETLQLKVDYSIAATPVRSKGGNYQETRSPCPGRTEYSQEVQSPRWDGVDQSSNHSSHSSTSGGGARSPIKKDFVSYPVQSQGKHARRLTPTSPIKRHVSPPQTVHRSDEKSSPAVSNPYRHYEEPYNQHRYPSIGNSSEFQVFNTSQTPDNILDIDKLRQMPKLL